MPDQETCACPSPEVALHAQKVAVGKYGWAVTAVADDPPFAYTTGLHDTWGHPELVIAGLSAHQAHGVLHAAVSLVADGAAFADGAESGGVLKGFRVRFAAITGGPFYMTRRHYGFDPARLQIIWPDPFGRFPGEEGCDTGMALAQMIWRP
jgi:uncharacterized protein DUF4262